MSDQVHGHEHDRDDHDLLDAILDRREFLRLAGASVALAGLDGCSRLPAEHILPYVDNRPELTPGVAQYYATAMCVDGYATGLIVESHTGRPTKVEGNPDHPASLGASGPHEQASVLQVYDPDRAKHARIGARRTDPSEVVATLASHIRGGRAGARGAGLHLLIEPTSSPLDEEVLGRVLAASPDARVYMYAPFARDRASAPTVRLYDLSSVDVILSVDNDFLATGPFHLRYARQFADGRRLERPSDPMNRLYVVETSFSSTGLVADHRFAMRSGDIAPLLRSLLALVQGGGAAPSNAPWLAAVARDLTTHKGRSVVVVGDEQPSDVRAVGDAINAAIGAESGEGGGLATWTVRNPLIGSTIPVRPFAELLDALQSRAVDTLVVVGGNPCYASPRALGLSELVRSVPTSVYLGLYENETAREAKSFIPMSHYLERWGDVCAYDGTLSIVQPLIKPLYPSMGPAELFASLAAPAASAPTSYDLLRASWDRRISDDTDAAWTDALQRGVVTGTAFPRLSAPVAAGAALSTAAANGSGVDAPGEIEVVYAADPKVHDGAFSNNGWLQELPAPVTQLTWGNAALVSPETAHRIGLESGDVVRLSAGPRSLELVALLVPGHAADAVTVHFGYGRTGAEAVARGVGANAYALWPALGVRSEPVSIARAGGSQALALAQTQPTMENGQPVRTATLEAYRAAPASVGQRTGRVLSLYPEPAPPVGLHGDNQWAMTIDLGTCIGCGACVVACQAENNIPVVGADQVQKGRAMQWIHVERYFADHDGETDALVQPMLCQHCEKAPCEYVCPVEATMHSADGLNEMVYNRCVGTRFCSNNCPYKVRHFNWFDYNKELSETELMVKNPNVSVRERGVMEKCTFCVQRIREADIAAGREGRTLHGSDVRTACQQACPTNAIVFGSLNDASSEMVRRRNQPRSYSALAELGTEPRVRYLARIRNANPELVAR